MLVILIYDQLGYNSNGVYWMFHRNMNKFLRYLIHDMELSARRGKVLDFADTIHVPYILVIFIYMIN